MASPPRRRRAAKHTVLEPAEAEEGAAGHFVDPGPDQAQSRCLQLVSQSIPSSYSFTDFTQRARAERELAWLQRKHALPCALAYISCMNNLQLAKTASALLSDLVSSSAWTQLALGAQEQALRLLASNSSAQDDEYSCYSAPMTLMLRNNHALLQSFFPVLVQETTRNASHLACLVLAELNLPEASEAVAEAVLNTNDVFFVGQLVRFHPLCYTQNVCSALIAGAMHSAEEQTSLACIRAFPAKDSQFAQVALHILQSRRAISTCRASLQYLCTLPQCHSRVMLFLVANVHMWLDLDCKQEFITLVRECAECADLLGLSTLEHTTMPPACRMLAIGTLCHAQWFSIQEADRFGREMVQLLLLVEQEEANMDGTTQQQQQLAMWCIQQAVECQPTLFFHEVNSFGRLMTAVLALLSRQNVDGGVYALLETLLQQLRCEQAQQTTRQRKDTNRFSFCFSQLIELLQRNMLPGGSLADSIANVICLLVEVSSSEMQGFVTWLLSRQVLALQARFSTRKRTLLDENDASLAHAGPSLAASLQIMHACILRLQQDSEVSNIANMLQDYVQVALKVWRLQCGDRETVAALALLRDLSAAANNNSAAYAEVIQCELVAQQRQPQPVRVIAALSLCFTQSLDPALFAHVKQLACDNNSSSATAVAATRAWGEMLARRHNFSELEEWIQHPNADTNQAMDLLMRYVDLQRHAASAALASRYLTHLVASTTQSNDAQAASKSVQLICLAAPMLPSAFENKYLEWKPLFDCAQDKQYLLEAMRLCGGYNM